MRVVGGGVDDVMRVRISFFCFCIDILKGEADFFFVPSL
jgi:hypothetical protein